MKCKKIFIQTPDTKLNNDYNVTKEKKRHLLALKTETAEKCHIKK